MYNTITVVSLSLLFFAILAFLLDTATSDEHDAEKIRDTVTNPVLVATTLAEIYCKMRYYLHPTDFLFLENREM